jgi:hypothetical protein
LGEAIAVVGTAGYVVLSVASIARLAESDRRLGAGDSVRVFARIDRKLMERRGRLASLSADSIVLGDDGVDRAYPLALVSRIDVYAGQESKWAQGWAIGFVGGAALGGVAGFASGDDPPGCDFICLNAGQKGVILGVFGALTASTVGAGIGALARDDHWRAGRKPSKIDLASRLTIAPVVGRATGLAARIAF